MLHTWDSLDLSSQTVALAKWPVSLGVLSVYVDLTGQLPSNFHPKFVNNFYAASKHIIGAPNKSTWKDKAEIRQQKQAAALNLVSHRDSIAKPHAGLCVLSMVH